MNLILRLAIHFLTFYRIAVFIYILLSWLPDARKSYFGRLLGQLVDPYLNIFRKVIPPIGMIDISPIFAVIILEIAARGLVNLMWAL